MVRFPRGAGRRAASAFLAAALLTAPPAPAARADEVLVFPGMEIRQDGTVCTLGFVDPVRRLAFTAGHCRGGGVVTDAAGNPIGTLAAYRDNTPDGTTVNTDQVIADYEAIRLDDAVAVNDILPGGLRLTTGPAPQAGEPVCHFGIVTGQTCGTVERVNDGWFTMTGGVRSRHGDSGGPVYVLRGDSAQLVGLLNSVWGELPAAVSWPAVRAQAAEDTGTPAS